MVKQRYKFLFGIGLLFGVIFPSFVWADETPQYSATPSAGTNESCTISAFPANGSYAPADIRFSIVSTIGGREASQFKYDFGDGVVTTGSGDLSHRYGQAGTYLVTAQPIIEDVIQQGSCEIAVTLKSVPFVPHKSECTGITLMAEIVPETNQNIQIQVKGFDNKGELTSYRIEANNNTWEQQGGDFEIVLATPGAYLFKAWVKDSTGGWVGGEGLCEKEVNVRSTEVNHQPETGPSSVYWLGLGCLFLIWLGAELWHAHNRRSIG